MAWEVEAEPAGQWVVEDTPQATYTPEKVKRPTDGNNFAQNALIGIGKGMTDIYQGGKQALGYVTEADVANKRALDADLMKTGGGQVGNIAGQAATFAPLALVPGANTYAGAALLGAAEGALQPVAKGESRTANAGFGAAGGVAGQKLGRVLDKRIGDSAANAATRQSQNATRDATLKASQDAGYTVPRSLYDPSFLSNRLESVGGKAAVKQQAAGLNQQATNSMARKALGLADDTPLSISAVEGVRNTAYQPYKEVAAISKNAADSLEKLKQARADASGWFNAYNRSASPDDLTKAKTFQAVADKLEGKIDGFAMKSGKPELLKQLKEARKTIAKTYTIERAMNRGTGDISAPVLGRLYAKGKPLSDGLDVAGRFANAFPQVSQAGASIPTPGVSKVEALAMAGMGLGGAYGTDSPYGAAAGLLPLLSHPARAAALSRLMQSTPQYGGILMNSASRMAPALPYIGTVGGGLLGANAN